MKALWRDYGLSVTLAALLALIAVLHATDAT